MRLVTTTLTLVLLLGVLPPASVSAADPDPDQGPGPGRTLADAVARSMDADAILAWTHDLAVAQGEAYLRLDIAKAAQRELARQHRRDQRAIRRTVSGQERTCQLAALEKAYQADRGRLGIEVVTYRAELGYGDRRKAFTKLGNRLGTFVRYLRGLAKEVLQEARPELIGVLAGGPVAAHVILRRSLAKVVKERLAKEALARLGVRSAAVLAHARTECREPRGPGVPAGSAEPGAAVISGAALAFDGVCQVTPEAYQAAGYLFAPPPPYEEPATLIYFDWDERDDVLIDYGVARDVTMFQDKIPGKDPAEASVTAGCSDGTFNAGAIDGCWPALPIVLTESEYPGAWNWVRSPGTYSILVQPAGACWYSGDDGLDWGRIDAVDARPHDIEVEATVAHYRAGETEPFRVDPPLTFSLPRGPSTREVATSLDPIDMTPYTHSIGSLEWDPKRLLEESAE